MKKGIFTPSARCICWECHGDTYEGHGRPVERFVDKTDHVENPENEGYVTTCEVCGLEMECDRLDVAMLQNLRDAILHMSSHDSLAGLGDCHLEQTGGMCCALGLYPADAPAYPYVWISDGETNEQGYESIGIGIYRSEDDEGSGGCHMSISYFLALVASGLSYENLIRKVEEIGDRQHREWVKDAATHRTIRVNLNNSPAWWDEIRRKQTTEMPEVLHDLVLRRPPPPVIRCKEDVALDAIEWARKVPGWDMSAPPFNVYNTYPSAVEEVSAS